MVLSKKAIFFSLFLLGQKMIKRLFHNILDEKETLFGDKKFHSFKIRKISFFFAKRFTHGFVQKCHLFSLFVLGQKEDRKIFRTILVKKESFYGDKNFIPSKFQKYHFFRKGVNPWFCPKIPFFFFICASPKKGSKKCFIIF